MDAFLAEQFNVYNYDRRGHGESGFTPPYAVGREIEDLAALITEAGGFDPRYGSEGWLCRPTPYDPVT